MTREKHLPRITRISRKLFRLSKRGKFASCNSWNSWQLTGQCVLKFLSELRRPRYQRQFGFLWSDSRRPEHADDADGRTPGFLNFGLPIADFGLRIGKRIADWSVDCRGKESAEIIQTTNSEQRGTAGTTLLPRTCNANPPHLVTALTVLRTYCGLSFNPQSEIRNQDRASLMSVPPLTVARSPRPL